MVKKFLMSSPAFEGEVMFEFIDELLVKFDQTSANLSEEQQIFLLKNLPRELFEVKKMLESSPTVKFTEVIEEITFDKFWNRYDEKIRSSKKKALLKWNRLSQFDRNKAFYYIPKYEMSIPNGVPKKYAETYLNSEIWNN